MKKLRYETKKRHNSSSDKYETEQLLQSLRNSLSQHLNNRRATIIVPKSTIGTSRSYIKNSIKINLAPDIQPNEVVEIKNLISATTDRTIVEINRDDIRCIIIKSPPPKIKITPNGNNEQKGNNEKAETRK